MPYNSCSATVTLLSNDDHSPVGGFTASYSFEGYSVVPNAVSIELWTARDTIKKILNEPQINARTTGPFGAEMQSIMRDMKGTGDRFTSLWGFELFFSFDKSMLAAKLRTPLPNPQMPISTFSPGRKLIDFYTEELPLHVDALQNAVFESASVSYGISNFDFTNPDHPSATLYALLSKGATYRIHTQHFGGSYVWFQFERFERRTDTGPRIDPAKLEPAQRQSAYVEGQKQLEASYRRELTPEYWKLIYPNGTPDISRGYDLDVRFQFLNFREDVDKLVEQIKTHRKPKDYPSKATSPGSRKFRW